MVEVSPPKIIIALDGSTVANNAADVAIDIAHYARVPLITGGDLVRPIQQVFLIEDSPCVTYLGAPSCPDATRPRWQELAIPCCFEEAEAEKSS
jgi:hypothetical protein